MPMGLFACMWASLVLAALPVLTYPRVERSCLQRKGLYPLARPLTPSMTMMHDSYKINALDFLKSKPDLFFSWRHIPASTFMVSKRLLRVTSDLLMCER